MTHPRPVLPKADWIRLNELLEQGLAIEPGGRAAWLAALPPEAATLRDLLRELLAESGPAADPPVDRFGSSVARVAADALAAMRRERPGDLIGPWRLERLLAEGGMGDVWLATRADGVLQRKVALKLPRTEWVDRGLTLRIARERSILARLQHPHIAVLYDAGVGQDGRPYLALEYVEGVPIQAWCQGREQRDVLRLFVQLSRAVAYAHAQLVIHRDLKPSNVLVTDDGTPKLLDFGISKMLEGDVLAANETDLTRESGRRLTLAYAAPEQVLGQPVGVACDVYALGVMLFELLTGQRLYAHTEGRALEDEILRGEPRQPSAAAADKARVRALRGDLDAIVLTALKREPGARYQSATALADDLDNYLAGQPVKARPDSRTYRLRKFLARNRLPVAAGTVVVIALALGLGVALWQAERATALNTFLLSLIRQADPRVSQQTRDADLAMLASIENKIDREFRGSPDQLLQLRLTVGEAYRNRGEMTAARRVFQRAADEAASQVAHDDLMLLTARVRASDYNLIVSTQASEQLDRAIDILRKKGLKGGATAELLIDALLIRHELLQSFGLPAYVPVERRLDKIREANDVALRSFGEGSRQQLRVVVPLAYWTSLFERRSAARQWLESSLQQAQLRNDGATASVEYLIAHANRAALRCEDGVEQAEALTAMRQAIDEVRTAHGPTSVLLEELLLSFGRCQRAAGDPTNITSEADVYEIAAARERPPATNVMRRAQGALRQALRVHDLSAAERFYRSAMENAEAVPEPAFRERLMTFARISRVCLLAQRGEAEAAEQAAAPLIADSDAVYAKIGRLTRQQGELWTCLSHAQRQQGRYAEALRTLQTFIERCRATRLSPELALTCEGEALIERALVELDTGRTSAAQATIEARLAMSRVMQRHPTYVLAYGRVLLATGRAAEAIEPLRTNYETWRSLRPDSPYAAEALYWLGRANQAVGEARGRQMVDQASKALANSPVKSHQRLATERKHRQENRCIASPSGVACARSDRG
jgi:tetratricopeptide (TPR) repeat protein/tRNA A-37 threonylcarbamoyl transferase component Bud32